MGCFNMRCMLSNRAIKEGERVYLIPVFKKADHHDLNPCYIQDGEYLPFGGIYEGYYDDYGSIEMKESHDRMTEEILKRIYIFKEDDYSQEELDFNEITKREEGSLSKRFVDFLYSCSMRRFKVKVKEKEIDFDSFPLSIQEYCKAEYDKGDEEDKSFYESYGGFKRFLRDFNFISYFNNTDSYYIGYMMIKADLLDMLNANIDERNKDDIPEPKTRRKNRLEYLRSKMSGHNISGNSVTIFSNILYGLKHSPIKEAEFKLYEIFRIFAILNLFIQPSNGMGQSIPTDVYKDLYKYINDENEKLIKIYSE